MISCSPCNYPVNGISFISFELISENYIGRNFTLFITIHIITNSKAIPVIRYTYGWFVATIFFNIIGWIYFHFTSSPIQRYKKNNSVPSFWYYGRTFSVKVWDWLKNFQNLKLCYTKICYIWKSKWNIWPELASIRDFKFFGFYPENLRLRFRIFIPGIFAKSARLIENPQDSELFTFGISRIQDLLSQRSGFSVS